MVVPPPPGWGWYNQLTALTLIKGVHLEAVPQSRQTLRLVHIRGKPCYPGYGIRLFKIVSTNSSLLENMGYGPVQNVR